MNVTVSKSYDGDLYLIVIEKAGEAGIDVRNVVRYV